MATALTPGDIAILGFRSGAPDGVAFVTFKDLDAGTMLGFTDASYQQPNTPGSWRGSENFAVWTAASNVPAGTVVVLSFPNTPPSTADNGAISSAGLSGISGNGDQIFVYQRNDGMVSASSPFATTGTQTTWNAANGGSLLFGINVAATSGFITSGTANLNSTNTSYLPDAGSGAGGLTLGATALNITSAGIIANAQYNGARTGLSIADFKAQILDQNNWSVVDGTTGTLNSTDLAIASTGTPTVGAAPKIAENTTTPFLNLAATGSGLASGVISDPTDPAKTLGIDFLLADTDTPVGNLTVTVASSNQTVVTNANLTLTGTGANRNLKINPTGVGLSDITVTVNDGTSTNAYIVKYAASAAGTANSRFLTGASNASTAIAIDSNYMLVGDDENQALRLYDRTNSGLAVNSFDYTTLLGLTDISGGVPREVDIEASAKVGNRIFWLGSQSNNDPAGNSRPNRDRLFATDTTGTGAGTSLSYSGRYDFLRADIINWDVTNGHGKGANFYGLAASAAAGVSSKANNGYNIEGLEFAPDDTTAYVAFRAPQEPTGTRTNALIVPVTNLTTLLAASGGGAAGTATFGAPIELDLGGRGIREIRKNASNQYAIIAGPAGDNPGTAPADFRLYTWTGNAVDVPVLRSTDLTALNAGGSFESIVEVPTSLSDTSTLQLLVDNGETVFYNDGAIAKDVAANFQKSRSELVTLGSTLTVDPITKINTIQGAGTAATAGTFAIEGIVVGDFQGTGQLGGFYLQAEDTDADRNPLTSEGIFVNSLTAVNVGDKVRVTGTVAENAATPSFNQAVITPTTAADISVLATGQQALVTPTVVDLPITTLGDLERYEGMLITIPEPLTVTEVFNLGRFGEVSLSADGRLFNPTNIIDPNDAVASGTNSTGTSNAAAVTAQQNLNNRRRILLDDGSTLSNLSDVPYIDTTDANPANDTLRIGSTISGLTGVLGFGFNNYRIQPTQAPVFNYEPRPALPDVGGGIKVGSFNVLNYFNGDGVGGGFPTSRGANTSVEFERQRAKIVSAIKDLNADVVGLSEMENDGDGANSAIVNLVNGLNAAIGSNTYDYIKLANTTGSPGTDQIKVAFIYKPGALTPVGNAVYFNDSAFNTARPPLAQTFINNASGEKFTPIVNHFKSKGSSAGLPGDADQGDGQGLSNATRKAQSTALLNFVAQVQTTSGDGDVMVLGDLNAYNEEDPIDILRAGGLTKLTTTTDSYVFDGQTGSLDHALVTSSLLAQVTGAAKWNINSSEPIVLDYNDDVLSSGENVAEDRNDLTLYRADRFRSSDHDPVLAGLDLKPIGGSPLADNLIGTSGSDPLFGGAGNDIINGGAGNDFITGGAGVDLLFGGTGSDTFVYYGSNEGIDKINDFEVGIDRLSISRAGFGGNATFGTDALGILDATRFGIGSSATTASQRFVYNNASGALFFDADGVGGAAQVRLAQLVGNPALTNASFAIF